MGYFSMPKYLLRQTLKAQVKEWQNKILEDFSAEIGL